MFNAEKPEVAHDCVETTSQALSVYFGQVPSGAVLGKNIWGPGPPKFSFPPFSLPLSHPFPPLSLNFPSHPCPPSPPFPFLPPSPFLFPDPFLSLPSLPLEVGPLNPARGSGGALQAPPAGSGAEPQTKSNLVHFDSKI